MDKRKRTVRPAKENLVVLDDNNRKIPFKLEGVSVIETAMIRRYIRDGDLIDVTKEKSAEKKGDKKAGK